MSSKKNKQTKKFLAMWDCNGLEYLEDISEYEFWDQEQTLELIKGNKTKSNPLWSRLSHMKLRAQFNPQRNYEIYAFTSDDSTVKEFKAMFKDCPQAIVDLIRANGVKIYSDRATNKPVIV